MRTVAIGALNLSLLAPYAPVDAARAFGMRGNGVSVETSFALT